MSGIDDLDQGATLNQMVPGQKVFGRYLLKERIGQGRKGEVWKAEDTRLNLTVAMKMLPNYAHHQKITASMADLLALTHPNIVRIYDFLYEQDHGAFVMEFVDGESLATLLRRRESGFFEAAEIEGWMRDLFAALSFAWSNRKMAHGDIRLANLIIAKNGPLKVAEFGFAPVRAGASLLQIEGETGSLSLPTLSPQVASGEPCLHQDDLYAASACAYELLTGKPVFPGGNVMAQIQRKVQPKITERRTELGLAGAAVPRDWEQWIARGLAKDRGERPASAAEILDLLALGVRSSTKKRAVTVAAGTVVGALRPRRAWVGWLGHPLGLVSGVAAAAAGCFVAFVHLPNQNQLKLREAQLMELRRADEAPGSGEVPEERLSGWKSFLNDHELQDLPFTTRDNEQLVIARKAISSWETRLLEKQSAERSRKLAEQNLVDDFEVAFRREQRADEVPGTDAETRLKAWTSLLAKFDTVDKPKNQAFEDLLSESDKARTRHAEVVAREMEQKKMIQLKAVAWLDDAQAIFATTLAYCQNEGVGAAAKVTAWAKFLDGRTIPPEGLDLAAWQKVKSEAEAQKTRWLQAAADETPKTPLDRKALLANSPYASLGDAQQEGVVRMAQEKLKEQGFYSSAIDGAGGKGMHTAIVTFQKDRQMVQNAQLDSATLEKLSLGAIPAEDLEKFAAAQAAAKPASSGNSSSRAKSSSSRTSSRRNSGPPPKSIYDKPGGKSLEMLHKMTNKIDQAEWQKHLRYLKYWEENDE